MNLEMEELSNDAQAACGFSWRVAQPSPDKNLRARLPFRRLKRRAAVSRNPATAASPYSSFGIHLLDEGGSGRPTRNVERAIGWPVYFSFK